MLHLSAITGAQIVLIEIGLVLLIIAIRSHLTDTTAYHRDIETRKDEPHSQAEESETKVTEAQPPAKHGVAKSVMTRTASLVRTSKVKFVQSFKFREYDPHHRHLPHH